MSDSGKSKPTILFMEWGLRLVLEADDFLVLNVLCGRVGMFGVEFALNPAEREDYKRDGDAFIKELADKVRANPKAYSARGRSC